MSDDTHHSHHSEHGTTRSYVIGFVLSLIFTIIPYYLVVEKVITGNALLATILGFAIVQMIIQVVFFLHIGRERKPYWQRWFLLGTMFGIAVVVGGSIWIMGHLHYNMSPVTREDAVKKLIEDEGIYQIGGTETGACHGQYTTYKMTITDDGIVPNSIVARHCDRLTFINESSRSTRYIMFGSFEEPKAYGGEDMISVPSRRPKTIILNETGTHQFHDHMYDNVTGTFTVTE
jgi:cytochrome o ubiquinol oxidase operon protein cyoD